MAKEKTKKTVLGVIAGLAGVLIAANAGFQLVDNVKSVMPEKEPVEDTETEAVLVLDDLA